MIQYISFFRMRFISGLQYRAAAYAGIVTQFVWGALEILLFRAFYEANPTAFPMELSALSSYIWLQQAFLALYMTWLLEGDIFQSITSGGIAYEMVRPINIYWMWFIRSMANRLSKAILRCMPILIIAAFIKKPYGMSLPNNLTTFLCFLFSMLLSFLVVVASCMLIYIITFYTMSALGVKLVAVSLIEFLSGAVIPLPFLPDRLEKIVSLLPFASMQNVPFRIYSGDIHGHAVYQSMLLQLFWTFVLIGLGNYMMARALKKIRVQGG